MQEPNSNIEDFNYLPVGPLLMGGERQERNKHILQKAALIVELDIKYFQYSEFLLHIC